MSKMLSFWDIWMANKDGVYAFLCTTARSKEDADEIIHRTLMLAITDWHSLRDEKRARSWFITIASRAAVRFYRDRQKEVSIDFEQVDKIIDEHGRMNDTKIATAAFLDKLPEIWRLALSMRLYGGFSYREIAEIINTPYLRTWRKLNRYIDCLANFLVEDEDSEDES